MSRPPLEVADIVRAAGDAFIERNRHWLRWKHVKVLLAIRRCRTAALGGHLDECTRCGHRAISFNSCRNRHCPKCQIAARERWIAARRRELLPTCYMHVVFTLPHRLVPLVLQNKEVLYNLLFHTSAETLREVARDPRHLGAEIGFFSVLHTWSQKLNAHPHVHCVIPAGGLSLDHTHWVRSRENYFLPKEVLRKVFRGKFVDALKQAFRDGQLCFQGDLKLLAQPKTFAAWLRPLYRQKPSRGYTVLIPSFPLSRGMSKSVQNGSNLVVTMAYGHPTDDLQRFHGCGHLGRGTRPFHLELSVCTSVPVNSELQSFILLFFAHDDLFYGCAKDHLLECRRTAIASPDFSKVLTHQTNSGFLFGRQ